MSRGLNIHGRGLTSVGRGVAAGSVLPESTLFQNLVAWYRFEVGDARDYASKNEHSNISWGDSTAYNGMIDGATHHSDVGVTDFESGRNSGAFEFSGSDYINISQYSGIETQPFSVCAWVYERNYDTRHYPLTMGSGDDFEKRGYFRLDNSSHSNRFRWNSGAAESSSSRAIDLNFPNPPTDNQWAHLAVTIGESSAEMYVNGTQVDSDSISGTLETIDGEIRLGDNFGNDPLDGFIDDFRFYNIRLSGSELSDIYNETKP